jgi:uncharacterized membrane protein
LKWPVHDDDDVRNAEGLEQLSMEQRERLVGSCAAGDCAVVVVVAVVAVVVVAVVVVVVVRLVGDENDANAESAEDEDGDERMEILMNMMRKWIIGSVDVKDDYCSKNVCENEKKK